MAKLARLAKLDHKPGTDPQVAIDGPGPTLFFQPTRQPKRSRNRIQFDLRGESLSSEIVRLEALGTSVRDEEDRYTVMLDPEGNEFCVQEN